MGIKRSNYRLNILIAKVGKSDESLQKCSWLGQARCEKTDVVYIESTLKEETLLPASPTLQHLLENNETLLSWSSFKN